MTIMSRAEFMAERARIICGLAATKTRDEIAVEVKCHVTTVSQILRDSGVKAVRKKYTSKNSQEERNKTWIAAYESGETNASQIAAREGVTRECVCQILRPHRVIEKRLERRRIVQEALSEEATRLKSEAKEAVEKKLVPALEMVRQGSSKRQAALANGFNRYEEVLLSAVCKREGIRNIHGRWQDFSDRERRVKELGFAGLTIPQIVTEMRANGDPHIHWNWVASNFPYLRRPRGRHRAVPESVETATSPQAEPGNLALGWTPERIELLRNCWAQGQSAASIAAQLGGGFTRNSVIGKVNRLRGEGRLFTAVEKQEPQSVAS